MNSIRPAIEELERAFQELAPIFKRPMPLPVMTIQTKGRTRAAGWFARDRWTNSSPDKLPEINICAEHLARSVHEIAEVLIHEMVHYANELDAIFDCTVRQYHNKNFKVRCEKVGLICERHPSRGWANTRLSADLESRVTALNINPEAFSLFRPDHQVVKTEPKMKKWRCGCTNIRAAVPVEAMCKKCKLEFILQPQLKNA